MQIETLINQTVNDLLKKMPEDPYAFIIGTMQKVFLNKNSLLLLQ